MADKFAEEYEADATLLEPGSGSKRLPPHSGRLGGAIPIRFTPEMVERIKAVARHDGLSVSSWVRTEVERSLDRREANGLGIASVARLKPGRPDEVVREARRSRRVACG